MMDNLRKGVLEKQPVKAEKDTAMGNHTPGLSLPESKSKSKKKKKNKEKSKANDENNNSALGNQLPSELLQIN